MLGFGPISSLPISALPSGAGGPLFPTRSRIVRIVGSHPPHRGSVRWAVNFHTGEAFYYQRRPPVRLQQEAFPRELVNGSVKRSPIPHTDLDFFYQRRPPIRLQQDFFPRNLVNGSVHRAKIPGPPFLRHPNKRLHQQWYPHQLLHGTVHRQRVPGSGLSSLPVHLWNRKVIQAKFPRWLLLGSIWTNFPQLHWESQDLPPECPDRRHFVDAADVLSATVPAQADTYDGRQPEGDTYSWRGEECK